METGTRMGKPLIPANVALPRCDRCDKVITGEPVILGFMGREWQTCSLSCAEKLLITGADIARAKAESERA